MPAEAVRNPNPAPGLCVFDIDGTITRHTKATEKVCGPLPKGPPCTNCSSEVEVHQRHARPSTLLAPATKTAFKRCLAAGDAVGIATGQPCGGKTSNHREAWLADLTGAGIPVPLDIVDGNRKRGPAYGCGKNSGRAATGPCVPRPDGHGLTCRARGLGIADPKAQTHKGPVIRRMIRHYHTTPQRTVFFDDNAAALRAAKKVVPGLRTQLAGTPCRGKWCLEACGLTKPEFERGFAKIHHRHHAGHH